MSRITNLNNHVWKFLCKVFNAGSSLFTSNNKLQKYNEKNVMSNIAVYYWSNLKETKLDKSYNEHDIEVIRI